MSIRLDYDLPKRKYTPPPQNVKAKVKVISREDRIESFSLCYKSITEEFNENNIPTNLYELFKELLSSLPKEHLTDSYTKSLFEEALISVIGKDNIKELPVKIYKEYI